MRVKHWHKWELYCTYNGGGTNGTVRICDECGARKRVLTKGTRFMAEYARSPNGSFESIKTGTGPNTQMLTARAKGRVYDAIAVLAWRQHECGEGNVEECAKRLGWNLGRRALMAKERPRTIELSDYQQRYNTFHWDKSDDPRDPGPYRNIFAIDNKDLYSTEH